MNILIKTLVIPTIKEITDDIVISFNVNYKERGTGYSKHIYTLSLVGVDNICTKTAIIRSNDLRLLTKLGKLIAEFITNHNHNLLADLKDNNRVAVEKLRNFICEQGTVCDLTKTDWTYC